MSQMDLHTLVQEIGMLDAGQFEELVREMAGIADRANEHNREDPDLSWVQAANSLYEAAEWVRRRHSN